MNCKVVSDRYDCDILLIFNKKTLIRYLITNFELVDNIRWVWSDYLFINIIYPTAK